MMQTEMLQIFNDSFQPIGIKTREEVHKKGYWHETFHCWFIEKVENNILIYLQLRSKQKKDYPNLFDITAAGHLEAHETVIDGIREVKEELGIEIVYDDLIYCGKIPYEVQSSTIIDKEIAHVHIYQCKEKYDAFHLQKEEVAGIVKTKLTDFIELWNSGRETITVEGFVVNEKNQREIIKQTVKKEAFVQHKKHYYEELFKIIKKYHSI